MRLPTMTWKGLIYYGEVFGFLLAWVGGAILVTQFAASNNEPSDWNQIASVEITATDISQGVE